MFFKRKAKPATPELIEARAFYGFAFHIVSVPEQGLNGKIAVCGYDNCLPASSVREVTQERVLESWERQHESWHWCRGCVTVLFDLSDDEVNELNALELDKGDRQAVADFLRSLR